MFIISLTSLALNWQAKHNWGVTVLFLSLDINEGKLHVTSRSRHRSWFYYQGRCLDGKKYFMVNSAWKKLVLWVIVDFNYQLRNCVNLESLKELIHEWTILIYLCSLEFSRSSLVIGLSLPNFSHPCLVLFQSLSLWCFSSLGNFIIFVFWRRNCLESDGTSCSVQNCMHLYLEGILQVLQYRLVYSWKLDDLKHKTVVEWPISNYY